MELLEAIAEVFLQFLFYYVVGIAILSTVFSYLVGSLPFSFIVAKLMKGVDIRKEGSGNVGATNVYRTCGAFSGILALILDSAKAGLTFLLFWKLFDDLHLALILGVIVVIGHCYPIFLKFKGGKGVACAAGLLLFLSPISTLILVIIFLFIVYFTQYVSLASMIIALLAAPLYYILYADIKVSVTLLILGLFIVFRHKANIVRIKNGNENKTRLFKK